jgi:hypothetical protein
MSRIHQAVVDLHIAVGRYLIQEGMSLLEIDKYKEFAFILYILKSPSE